jgi:hypothetical protein
MKTSSRVHTSELSPARFDTNEMASAIAQLEVGCKAVGRALLRGAQARAGGAAASLKGRLLDTETGVEKLIARVPALGPMLAMSMYRATRQNHAGDDIVTRPSNLDDAPEILWANVYPYLDEIGLRTA